MDVRKIESAIANLPPAKIAEVAKWFEEFQASLDQPIESDLKAVVWILCWKRRKTSSLIAAENCEASGFARFWRSLSQVA